MCRSDAVVPSTALRQSLRDIEGIFCVRPPVTPPTAAEIHDMLSMGMLVEVDRDYTQRLFKDLVFTAHEMQISGWSPNDPYDAKRARYSPQRIVLSELHAGVFARLRALG
jgi:hypothetical protein